MVSKLDTGGLDPDKTAEVLAHLAAALSRDDQDADRLFVSYAQVSSVVSCRSTGACMICAPVAGGCLVLCNIGCRYIVLGLLNARSS